MTINAHFKDNWRKKKRRVKSTLKAIMKTRYFIGCDGKPYQLERHTGLEYISSLQSAYDADVDGISLDGKSGYSCSLFYCVPEAVTREVALRMQAGFVCSWHGKRGESC